MTYTVSSGTLNPTQLQLLQNEMDNQTNAIHCLELDLISTSSSPVHVSQPALLPFSQQSPLVAAPPKIFVYNIVTVMTESGEI